MGWHFYGLIEWHHEDFPVIWKDDTPSQTPYFALQLSLTHFPPRAPSPHSLSRQWRYCWRDALSLLIQPSVRAQSSIHSCHILILSLGSASGSPVKELSVWGVKRGREWCTEIHLQIHTVTQTLKHLPTKTHIYTCIYIYLYMHT